MTLAQPSYAEAPPLLALRPDVPSPDAASFTGRAYVKHLAAHQELVARRIRRAIPDARVRWRYRIVLNGMAVVVPRTALPRLARVAGVERVFAATSYTRSLDRSVPLIGAPTLWGTGLATAGQGIKIGIIDDGIDVTHPFFASTGYAYPPGFPKGDTRFTSPKVIVARVFPAPSPLAVHRDVAFDPENCEHGTHVAGIAAGVDGTLAPVDGLTLPLAGVAPRAYLGSYKVMSVPTPQFGINGNSPQIVAGIEAAVRDGMDIINLSLGEPEVAQGRDIVVRAIENAAKAGVVPVVAAGNDFGPFGDGSVSSPGSAPSAITVAASGAGRGIGSDEIADFSSGGPTPISLQLKPDVTAPGSGILSSVPRRAGSWAAWQGTSMASPHVAGAAALLLGRHPDWTVAQVKSALVLTGQPVYADEQHSREVSPTRQGGGRIDLARADAPLIFAAPTSVSFGLVRPGTKPRSARIALADAGGGAGAWVASVRLLSSVKGVTMAVPAQVTVPGAVSLTATAPASAPEGDVAGFVVLSGPGGVTRQIPFWLHVERPRLAGSPTTRLNRAGTYTGTTRGKPSRVLRYRYPAVRETYPGPEQVFRFRLPREVANAGVVVTSLAPGVRVMPHIVVAGDENRLTGYAGLPLDINPYQRQYGVGEAVAAVDLPLPGMYDAVFDTPSGGRPGAFRFRFWINDTAPPKLQLRSATTARGKAVVLRVSDAGSGVDPDTIVATLGGKGVQAVYNARRGTISVPTAGLAAGKHQLAIQVADYQEAKNMENTGAVLSNTRVLRAAVTLS